MTSCVKPLYPVVLLVYTKTIIPPAPLLHYRHHTEQLESQPFYSIHLSIIFVIARNVCVLSLGNYHNFQVMAFISFNFFSLLQLFFEYFRSDAEWEQWFFFAVIGFNLMLFFQFLRLFVVGGWDELVQWYYKEKLGKQRS